MRALSMGVAVGISIVAGVALAQAPGWSRGQQDLRISYEECRKRCASALRGEGFRIDHDAGAFTVGQKDVHTAVISCHPITADRNGVNIVVASNGPGGGDERVKLQQGMDRPASAQPPPPPPPPPPQQGVTWSGWINNDVPDASGDWEQYSLGQQPIPCARPSAIDCRVAADDRDWRAAGQRYNCSLDLGDGKAGGVCKNADNPPNGCLDYKIRFGCPTTGQQSRVTPPATPDSGGTWTGWLNRDDPGASADWEAFVDLKANVPCARPSAIECRTSKDKRDWRTVGQRYSCSLDGPNPGGICINADNQPGNCLDYEVRFRCDP